MSWAGRRGGAERGAEVRCALCVELGRLRRVDGPAQLSDRTERERVIRVRVLQELNTPERRSNANGRPYPLANGRPSPHANGRPCPHANGRPYPHANGSRRMGHDASASKLSALCVLGKHAYLQPRVDQLVGACVVIC